MDETKLTADLDRVAALLSKGGLSHLNVIELADESRLMMIELREARSRSVEPQKDMVERARAFAHRHVNCLLDHCFECDELTSAVTAEFTALRTQAVEECAIEAKTTVFLLDIIGPEVGPFTRQDRTRDQVVEQIVARIRALAPATRTEKVKVGET